MKENYFSSNLKFLRKKNHITLVELAENCNISKSAISYWENSQRQPNAIDVYNIASFFNVTVDDFINRDLRLEQPRISEFDILFSKYKDVLSDKDKDMIKFIIEQRKKEIDEQENK